MSNTLETQGGGEKPQEQKLPTKDANVNNVRKMKSEGLGFMKAAGLNKKSSISSVVSDLLTKLVKRKIYKNPFYGLSLYKQYRYLPKSDLMLEDSMMRILDWVKGENKLKAIQMLENVLRLKDSAGGPGFLKFKEKCKGVLMKDSKIKSYLIGGRLSLEEYPNFFDNKTKGYRKLYTELFEYLPIDDILSEPRSILKGYKKAKSQAERENYLHGVVTEFNPKLDGQLKEFNDNVGISLRPMSLRQIPFEFVFINTWENPKDKTYLPVCITLNLDELKNPKAIEIIKGQYKDEVVSKQAELWKKRGFDFDLPKNGKTSFMLSAVPKAEYSDTISHTERGIAKIADMYRAQYGAKWEGVFMQDSKAWKATLSKEKLPNVPDNVEPTKENILNNLRSNLIKAIDSGQEMFLFQYLMHGSREGGEMASSSGSIYAEEYASVLGEAYNGKSLAAQINITLIIESCFGGAQLDKIIDHLHAKNIPVKGLRIVSGSQREVSYISDAMGTTSSLLADAPPNTPIINYLTDYFKWIRQRKAKGEAIIPPLGTMGHAIAFIDTMQKGMTKYEYESKTAKFVDLQGYYYSTEKPIKNPEHASPPNKAKKKKEKPKGYYFSENQAKKSDRRYG